jgi:DNA-binding GntR family transcriptional regulator
MRAQPAFGPIVTTSLREQVYDILRDALERADLKPGETIDLNDVCRRLGVSKTPLREALLKLEVEGFVTIKPRSGVVVRTLAENDIKNLYQLIGALESSVLLTESERITSERVRVLRRCHDAMDSALKSGDFDLYFSAGQALQSGYLDFSTNSELKRLIQVMKQRLYDFPKKKDLLIEWETATTKEHHTIIAHLEDGDAVAAAEMLRDVHWSFRVQERFVRIYYREELEGTE